MRIVVVFFFISIAFTGFSQYDSLIRVTENALKSYNPVKALYAIEKGKKSPGIDSKGIRQFNVLKVKAIEVSGLNDRVIDFSNELLKNKKYSIREQIKIRLSRSLAYEILDERDLVLSEFDKMAHLFEKIGDTTNQLYGNYLYRKSSFFRVTGNLSQAFEFAKRSEKHAKAFDQEDNLAVTNMILSMLNQNSRKQRRYYIHESLRYWKKTNDYHGMSSMYGVLSKLARDEKDFKTALAYTDTILGLPIESHLDHVKARAYLVKSAIYERLSLPDSALFYYKKHVHFSTRKDLLAQQFKLKELQQSFQTREVELINKDLRKTKKNTESRNRLLIISLVALVIVIIVITLLIIKVAISRKELKVSNARLTDALNEKRILLKEVNHRVKNNLSLVINLIKFQEESTNNEIAKDQLNDLYYRIESMALAQKGILTDSNENETVSQSMRTYVNDLIRNIISIDARKITLELEVDDVQLYVNTMIPLGLIINELVSNTLKHTTSSEIVITSTITIEGDYILLDYKNDSKPAKMSENPDGMGTFILQGMVEQLNGTIINNNYDYIIRLKI